MPSAGILPESVDTLKRSCGLQVLGQGDLKGPKMRGFCKNNSNRKSSSPEKKEKIEVSLLDFHLRFWDFSNHLAVNKLACTLFKLIETLSKHFILLMVQKSQGQPPGIKKNPSKSW